MAVGKVQHEQSVPAGLEFVHRTSILGRKRVVLSKTMDSANLSSPCGAPSKRRVTRWRTQTLNRLEALPLDILVKTLSKVDHSDLKQLLLVSKTVNGATLIARESHFVFSTPISKSLFKKQSNTIDSDLDIINEEAPHAPNQQRVARSRLNGVQLSSVAIALFT
ncbi:unnamed protein product [Musa acuminata subsp. malaccensis]|uniref:(wild Malaysian banana) hypothetical protein n=1 Tax=Musa acuminata subsp. malaccensis TaxID=214687 RepID=A0A804JMC1_MUSAM|nr:PREDICTED: F-box protein At1g61340 [Musa acuminata subsp. malaccensis]XP_018683058.1 PREDICTED: F-box protein At1g61340 [Musa acuminata subsp. malaccensis]CAG1847925.1 unnamed protein product [Musa acuminata subsp. malaccensis]